MPVALLTMGAGAPTAVVARLGAAMETAMQSPEVREKLLTIGVEFDYRRIDEFTRYLADQSARYADIIKKGNIKIE
jgi:tripartite-type tricarboxylate transporter receptor subunit TctC